jgi:hypothetical protein
MTENATEQDKIHARVRLFAVLLSILVTTIICVGVYACYWVDRQQNARMNENFAKVTGGPSIHRSNRRGRNQADGKVSGAQRWSTRSMYPRAIRAKCAA